MEVRRVEYKRGKILEAGEKSRALYGIVGTKKNVMLRIAIQQELAELQTQCDSRHLQEIFLVNAL